MHGSACVRDVDSGTGVECTDLAPGRRAIFLFGRVGVTASLLLEFVFDRVAVGVRAS